MLGNIWQNPAGEDPHTLYLWANEMMTLLRRGLHQTTKTGSLTLSAGTTSTITDDRAITESVVLLSPSNTAAAAIVPVVTVANGFIVLAHSTAVGTETYNYVLVYQS